MAAVLPKEIREARAYLEKQGIGTKNLHPRLFAEAAKESRSSFSKMLNRVAVLLSGGQGLGPSKSKVTEDIDRLRPEHAIGGEKIPYAEEAKNPK